MTLKLSILIACSRFDFCVKVRACVLKLTWLMSPRKSYVSLRKRSPRIFSPPSEVFSPVLFSSATATFPIWASAVKTGGISSPLGFPCLPRCLCLTTVSRSSFKLWPPNLPGLVFTRLSILAASVRVTRLKSRDLFPLELFIYFYLVSSPPRCLLLNSSLVRQNATKLREKWALNSAHAY